jgi:hypothetical protein
VKHDITPICYTSNSISVLFFRKYQSEVLVVSVDLYQSCSFVCKEAHHPWDKLHKEESFREQNVQDNEHELGFMIGSNAYMTEAMIRSIGI